MMLSRVDPVGRRRRFTGLALAAGVATVLAIPASAGAAMTIGSSGGPPTFPVSCQPPGCTFSQRSFPVAGVHTTAPTDGVIVRWRLLVGAGSEAQQVTFKVIRGTGAASRVVGSSQAESVPATAGTHPFNTRVPIQAGDYIGIECCDSKVGWYFRTFSGAHYDYWNPPLGATPATPSATQPNAEVLVNAELEPDCDRDGFGDETQDPELPLSEACGKGSRTLTLDTNKSKVKKGKKVGLSGRLEEAGNDPACEAGQTIEVLRDGLKRGAPQVVATLTTDSQGSYSTKLKMRKTSLLTARAPETAACLGGSSDTEKVKVKKPKP